MFSSDTQPPTPDGHGHGLLRDRSVETDLAVQTFKALKPPASPARANTNHEEG